MTWAVRVCAKCGGPCTSGARKTGMCVRCWDASPEKKKIGWATAAAMHEASKDWASDPCHRCGKWPLSILNKTGYCRKCSRNHAAWELYGRAARARKGAKESVDAAA